MNDMTHGGSASFAIIFAPQRDSRGAYQALGEEKGRMRNNCPSPQISMISATSGVSSDSVHLALVWRRVDTCTPKMFRLERLRGGIAYGMRADLLAETRGGQIGAECLAEKVAQ